MKKWYLGIGIGVVALGGAAALLFLGGRDPIVSVNGTMISSQTFESYVRAEQYAYDAFVAQMAQASTQSQVPKLTASQIRVAALNRLIENQLIETEARRDLGAEFDEVLKRKLENVAADTRLYEGGKLLYQTADEFERFFLIPSAVRSVLEGRLFLRDERLDNWLARARETVDVRVYSQEFFWKDGAIVRTGDE